MGVRVNFTSQSTTAALSIENGSLFEGESEFEKLKIYLITLVSIRSDWEDLPWLFRSVENLNTMAEQNVPAQAPTRTDEQIVPRSQWLQIGKSNLLFDAQKIQKNQPYSRFRDIESDDHDLELAKKMSLDAHQEKGEGEGADADIE
ncbi:hypothetical protein Tco_1132314 [Tanacetum coccineum]|uniref:Uncharacterized protein n=1 Tax=Tanacetum coccineum TaxID=301880 RepID=A0ABQ5JEL5_9ASTR